MITDIFKEIASGLAILFLGWIGKKLLAAWKTLTSVQNIKDEWVTLKTPRSKYYYLQSVQFTVSSLRSGQILTSVVPLLLVIMIFLMNSQAAKSLLFGIMQLFYLAAVLFFMVVFSVITDRLRALENVVDDLFKEVIAES